MKHIVLLGAGSFVAVPLVKQLLEQSYKLTVISRDINKLSHFQREGCQCLNLKRLQENDINVDVVISLMPIWETARILPELKLNGLQKAILVSSSSVINKKDSSYAEDKALVASLQTAEDTVEIFLQAKGITSLILRPTMLFGYKKDGNISRIRSILKRFHIMPFLGKAQGLRQPIHADDLANAIFSWHTERV